MKQVEPERFQDDFEVEITDVDPPTRKRHAPLLRRAFLRSQWVARQRRHVLIALNVLLLLAVALLLFNTASVRQLLDRAVLHPTPTVAPGLDLFYVRASPPWGQLTIDGQAASLPRMGIDAPLRLTPGQHLLAWRAAPFITQRCVLTVPRNAKDTCKYRASLQLRSGLSAWIVTFSESLAMLPLEQRSALLQAIEMALNAQQSTETIQPGEHYILAPSNPACSNAAKSFQCYATADQPLKATLSFRLDTDENSSELCINSEPDCTYGSQNCHLLCEDTLSMDYGVRTWSTFAPVHSLWSFATLDGHVLAHDVPDNSSWDLANHAMMDESLVQLESVWDGSNWRITLSTPAQFQRSGYFNPPCAALVAEIGMLAPPVDANGQVFYPQWLYIGGTSPASGCLAVAEPAQGTAQKSPIFSPQKTISYLHRYGVLLTVNQQSQQPGLALPIASPYEQELAQRMAMASGVFSGGRNGAPQELQDVAPPTMFQKDNDLMS